MFARVIYSNRGLLFIVVATKHDWNHQHEWIFVVLEHFCCNCFERTTPPTHIRSNHDQIYCDRFRSYDATHLKNSVWNQFLSIIAFDLVRARWVSTAWYIGAAVSISFGWHLFSCSGLVRLATLVVSGNFQLIRIRPLIRLAKLVDTWLK